MKYQFVFQILYFQIVSLNWSKLLIKSRQCRNLRPLDTCGLRGLVYLKVTWKFSKSSIYSMNHSHWFPPVPSSICNPIRYVQFEAVPISTISYCIISYAVSAVIIKWNDSTGIHLVNIVNSINSNGHPCYQILRSVNSFGVQICRYTWPSQLVFKRVLVVPKLHSLRREMLSSQESLLIASLR